MTRRQLRILVPPVLLWLALTAEAAVNVGLATPMDKVMIKGLQQGWPFEGWTSDHYDLSLARFEHEAFQVVAWSDQALTNVTVGVSTPQPTGGQGSFNGTVNVSLVGHVDVSDDPMDDLNITYPSYLVSYTGWWPDPLLTFQQTCNINANERVAFWIDVATQANTPPGDYTATVTVTATGQSAVTLQLYIHVWDIVLPLSSSLPTAFSCEQWMADALYDGRRPSDLENKIWDMQLGHRLNITQIYDNTPAILPAWYSFWMARGETMFCASLIPTSNVADLMNVYNDYKNGRLDQLYVYGYDEIESDRFQEMYDSFTSIHSTFPGLRTMTTAKDYTFGTSSATAYLRSAVDIWVPTTAYFKTAMARNLRAEGKDMWGYVAVGPRHPYANWHIEYPAIEARLLLGGDPIQV